MVWKDHKLRHVAHLGQYVAIPTRHDYQCDMKEVLNKIDRDESNS